MKLAAALLCCAALVGCASKPMVWDRAGSTEDDFHRDRGQCIQAAFSVPLADNFQKQAVFVSCMQGKGWRERPA